MPIENQHHAEMSQPQSMSTTTVIDAVQQASFEDRAQLIKRLVDSNLVGEAQCNVSACGGKCRGAT